MYTEGSFWAMGKPAKSGKVALVLVVHPVVSFGIIGISKTFNLKTGIANLEGSALGVGPEANNLGTSLNVQAKSVNEISILDQSEIALPMVCVVLVVPGNEVRIATRVTTITFS